MKGVDRLINALSFASLRLHFLLPKRFLPLPKPSAFFIKLKTRDKLLNY